jgi:AmmeMemoRadiSam system protein B
MEFLSMDSAPTERPAHIERPHLRRIIPQPVSAENQQGVALRDPLMLCDQTIVVPAPTMQALQHFNGEWTLDEIATNLKVPTETVEALVTKLDEVGLLWGPTCESLEGDKRDSLHATGVLPMRQSQSLGKDETACGAAIDSLLDKSEDPEVEFDIVGMFAPRIDYPLAGPIYGALYHAVRNGGYDRVLALGNNHYGFSDGVVGTPLGFQSPLGRCECDTTFLDGLVGHLGDAFISDELDHIADHGIEMQVPWIQHALPDTPIVGVLLPDPMTDPVDDKVAVTAEAFIETAQAVMGELGGRTLIIATGDLSHAGLQFGEPRPIDDQRRLDIEQADRSLLSTVIQGDRDAFLSAVKWNANQSRWSGVGALGALLGILKPSQAELVDYRQHDLGENGQALVSSAGLVFGA